MTGSSEDTGAGSDSPGRVAATRVAADAGDGPFAAFPILIAALAILALTGAFLLLRSRRTPPAQAGDLPGRVDRPHPRAS